MDRQVVQVVARFDGTIIDLRHLDATASYRIGVSPSVDLIVPGLSSFPLVDRGAVRAPTGCAAASASGTTALQLGSIHIEITQTTLAALVVPRPRFDVRPIVFMLASLIVHVAVWWMAARRAPAERVARPRPRPIHIARFVETPPPRPPPRPPAPSPSPSPSPSPRRSRPSALIARRSGAIAAHRATSPEPPGVLGDTTIAAIQRVTASFDKLDLAHSVGDLTPDMAYDEEAAKAKGFGGARRFDPDQREGWGTVESGPFVTAAYNVTTCAGASCAVNGPISARSIRMYVHKFLPQISACWDRAGSVPGDVTLEFTIASDGSVLDARGEGLDGAGACAATVAAAFVFEAHGEPTHVRYVLRFNPPFRL